MFAMPQGLDRQSDPMELSRGVHHPHLGGDSTEGHHFGDALAGGRRVVGVQVVHEGATDEFLR